MVPNGDSAEDEKRRTHKPVARAGGDVLSTSDREIAIAVNLLPVAALIYDRDDGTIRHANPLFESLVGVTAGGCTGHRISDFYRDVAEHDEFISRLLREGVVGGRHVIGTLVDGDEVWLDTSSRWVVYADRPAVLTLFTNIDAEKRAQLASEIEQVQILGLAEISAIMASRRPGAEVFEAVANVVKRLIPFDRIGIALLDPEYGTFTLKFIRGVEIEGRKEGDKLLIGQSMNAVVVDSRESLVINDIEATTIPDDFPSMRANRRAGIRSLVSVPMIADDRVVGSISLRSKSADAYQDESVALIERVAALIAPALEQSRLYENLEREAHERQIIAEIGRVISSSPNVDELYDRFAELVRQILPADCLVVAGLLEGSEKFAILNWSGIQVTDRASGQQVSSAGSLIPIVTDTRQPVLFQPLSRVNVEREYPVLLPNFDAGLRSFLSTPLFVGDRIVGALQFFSMAENDYHRRHVEVAGSVAGQIAGAIASSMLREVEQQTARENAVLAELGRIITSETGVHAVFERFGQLVGKILPISRLVVTLIDPGAGVAAATYVYGKELPGRKKGDTHEIAGTPLETLMRARQSQYVPDVTKDIHTASDVSDMHSAAGLHSSLMVPLWSNGDLIGCLTFKHVDADVYAPRSIELAERIADQIAGAIANARLYEDLQYVADERRALAAIALAATQNPDLNSVFARAADSLKKMVDYERVSITLLDPDDGALRVAFTRGTPLRGFQVGDIVEPLDGDPFDGEHWTWERVPTPGSSQDDRAQNMLQVPLGSHPRLLGYVRLYGRTADAYDERSIDMLERVATYLTPAIQNSLERDRETRLAQERERSLFLDHENRELQRLAETKSQFLTTVTHELKTPLTSITAFTNILLKNRVGGMTERDLSQLVVIQRNNRRLKNLIDDLLDLSQIDQGGLSLTVSEFNAGEMLAEVLDGFRPITDAKSQEIVSSFPSKPVGIRADRDRLAQIMTNLLSNASKYSAKGAQIDVSARRWKDRLYFSVTDHGIGISDDDRKSLFTLFFRADNEETRAVPGTGIGLYIAKTIVDLHGGKIEARPPMGDKTTISFYVPGAYSGVTDAELKEQVMARVIPWSRMDELPEPFPGEQEEAAS